MDNENARLRQQNGGGPDQPAAIERQKTRTEGVKYTFCFAFKQQLMRAWQPVPTLTCGIVMFFLFGLLFLAIGIALLIIANNLKEFSFRYDDQGACAVGSTNASNCVWNLQLDSDMKGPVFVYYEIKNFYQNHRKYFKSKSTDQLRGVVLTASTASDCDPVTYNRDLYVTKSITNATLDGNQIAHPCGSMARSIFNDTYNLYPVDNAGTVGTEIAISSSGIAWPQDKQYKFKLPSDISNVWYNVTDERFMVWMRASATPTFRKLWGRIDNDLKAGSYRFKILSNWPVDIFGGEKKIVFSQTNAFGGKNVFLASCYIIIGGLCLIAAIVFLIRKLVRSKGILEAKLE